MTSRPVVVQPLLLSDGRQMVTVTERRRPRMRKIHIFLLFFCSVYFLESIGFNYLTSSIQNIERQFQIQSKTSGLIITASEFGYIPSVLVISYLGAKGNRARWIGAGAILMSVSYLLLASPHFLFNGNGRLDERLNCGRSDGVKTNSSNFSRECSNHLPYDTCSAHSHRDEERLECSKDEKRGPIFLMFICLFFLGIGRTVPWTLGVPLLDDNVQRQNAPNYYGILSFIRILGPVFGHLLSSFTNRLYFNLSPPFGLTTSDRSWIGAWWLGFVIVGATTLLFSLCLFMFTAIWGGKNEFSTQNKVSTVELYDRYQEVTAQLTFKQKASEFFVSYKQVLLTPIFTASVLGRTFDMLALKGYLIFLPKYLEVHFGLAQHVVHKYLAAFGVTGFAVGILGGGWIMKRFKLNGRQAALLVISATLINLVVFFSKNFITCEGSLDELRVRVASNTSCSASCHCQTEKFFPICSEDGRAYFSPCHAGCKQVHENEDGAAVFHSCFCAPGTVVLSSQLCRRDCPVQLGLFFFTVIFGSIIGGIAVVPVMLLPLRSVPPATRSISLGLNGFVISLLGTLPSPILWGYVVDSTCQMWGKGCEDEHGNCLLYKTSALRLRIHTLFVIIRFIGLLFDIYIFHKSKGLLLVDENQEVLKKCSAETEETADETSECLPMADREQ